MIYNDNFPSTKTFVENYKKRLNQEPLSKHCLGLSYICSYNYELYNIFDGTETKIKVDNLPNKKDKSFCKNIVAVQEEWCCYINLTYSATFPLSQIRNFKNYIQYI